MSPIQRCASVGLAAALIALGVVGVHGVSSSSQGASPSLAAAGAAPRAAAQTPAPTPAAPPAVVAGIPANYDEAKVGSYTLPDPLVMADGTPVRDARTWTTRRRPELVRLFEQHQFGRSPRLTARLPFDVFDQATPVFDGAGIRRQITLSLASDPAAPKVDLLLYLPANARGPVPVLLNLSFGANSATVDDPGVKPGMVWDREGNRVSAATAKPIGAKLNPRPFLAAGIGVATMYYGDIEPDLPTGLAHSVRKSFLKPGQTTPAADEWGAIGAWAWGMSRALDYLETDKAVDAKRVAIVGISRLGKTVMWAGAADPRFAMVIASCSGEGGAAVSRRTYGETVKHLGARYGYWFDATYASYGDRVDQMPVDANLLVALIAPRPLLLQTGDTDYWSDPKGEFIAAVSAGPVYRLLGKEDLGVTLEQMPKAGAPILHTLGYAMHAGGHGTIPSDWELFLKFMQMHL